MTEQQTKDLAAQPVTIRMARPEDAEELLAVYAPYVEQTAVTFEYEVPTAEEFRTRIRGTLEKYPYFVAERGGKIIGYAYAGAFKERPAYDWAVETSIYVERGCRRTGVGRKLHEALEEALKRQGILNMYACIAYPPQEDKYLTLDSVRFHEKLGYRMVGRFEKCGYKYNRWYDMVWMERMIGRHAPLQPPVKWNAKLQERRAYKVAVFDLDGTILDTLEDLTDSTNAALQMNGFPTRTIAEVRAFVGNGIQKLIERAVPAGTSDEKKSRVLADFKEYYGRHCADKTKPYPGVTELLLNLRAAGMQTAVVSNKADFAVQSLCRDYFPNLFDVVVGEREGIRKKPCPDSLLAVLQKLGAKSGEAVYIGDSEVDILTAKKAGIDCVTVDWGFRAREFLKEQGAVLIVSSPQALAAEIVPHQTGKR